MMQCVRRCSFICGAVLSILLLLCSCQAGAGPLILPDNIPSENTSQGKKELLAALNTIGIRRPETTQDSYIPGADSVARTLLINRSLLVYSKSFQPDASQKIGFAVGVIGGQALVVAVFVS